MSPIEERDVADALHELRARAGGERCKYFSPGVTIADARLHLDELVIVERTLELGDDGRTDPRLPDQHDGLAIVSESAQVLALGKVERGRIR